MYLYWKFLGLHELQHLVGSCNILGVLLFLSPNEILIENNFQYVIIAITL